MGVMVERIRGIKARPVIFSASPINNGSTLARLGGSNRLHEYAVALKEFAAKEKLPYADQFHVLVDLWANNKPKELLANSLVVVKQLAQDESLTGVEHLRAFLAAQDKIPTKPVSMQGDAVHPGPSRPTDDGRRPVEGTGRRRLCQQRDHRRGRQAGRGQGVQGGSAQGRGRQDRVRPVGRAAAVPVPDDARAVLPLYPTILD